MRSCGGSLGNTEGLSGYEQKYTGGATCTLHCEFSDERIYVLHFDRSLKPAYCAPKQLQSKYEGLLERILAADYYRMGEITPEGIILRLQHSVGADQGRLILFPKKHVEASLNRLSPTNPLTESEQRTALRLVCGYSLKEAASVDGVSYETRRVQLKAILSKSKLKRQIDLCNFIIAQLLSAVEREAIVELERSSDRVFTEFVNTFLPQNVSSHTVIAKNGWQHRYIEMGPRNGRAMIVLHGHYIPYLAQSAIDCLMSQRIRLIWPLRNGFLGPTDRILSFDQHVQHAVQSIELAKAIFLPKGQAVSVVAIGCSSHYGIAHAEIHNSTAEQYSFVGASTSQARKLLTVDLSSGFRASASNINSLLTDYLLSLTAQPLVDSSHLRKLLTGAYSTSAPDRNLIEAEFSSRHRSEALMYQFNNSSNSVKHDCCFYITPDWAIVKTIQQPIQFIHGRQDGINRIDDIKQISTGLGATLSSVPHAGQLVVHSHFKECLSLFSKQHGSADRVSRVASAL
jgi:hypothetical protein